MPELHPFYLFCKRNTLDLVRVLREVGIAEEGDRCLVRNEAVQEHVVVFRPEVALTGRLRGVVVVVPEALRAVAGLALEAVLAEGLLREEIVRARLVPRCKAFVSALRHS